MQGWIQDFLREGAGQADMTDVQSQKSAEELPNDCFNRIFDCSIRVSRSFAIQVARHNRHLVGPEPCLATLGYTTATP